MGDPVFTPDDFDQAEECNALGPAYFAARRVCERAMAAFEAEHMKPLIDELCSKINDRIWESVQASLWSDVEMNLQGQMWTMVDETVSALLGGRPWALQRHLLQERCNDVRAAVAAHIPAELQDARVKDLEREVEQLRERINWLSR